MTDSMTPTARRILTVALHAHFPALAAAPRDGWEHYLTGADDSGTGTFCFDHPAGWAIRLLTRRGVVILDSVTVPR